MADFADILSLIGTSHKQAIPGSQNIVQEQKQYQTFDLHKEQKPSQPAQNSALSRIQLMQQKLNKSSSIKSPQVKQSAVEYQPQQDYIQPTRIPPQHTQIKNSSSLLQDEEQIFKIDLQQKELDLDKQTISTLENKINNLQYELQVSKDRVAQLQHENLVQRKENEVLQRQYDNLVDKFSNINAQPSPQPHHQQFNKPQPQEHNTDTPSTHKMTDSPDFGKSPAPYKVPSPVISPPQHTQTLINNPLSSRLTNPTQIQQIQAPCLKIILPEGISMRETAAKRIFNIKFEQNEKLIIWLRMQNNSYQASGSIPVGSIIQCLFGEEAAIFRSKVLASRRAGYTNSIFELISAGILDSISPKQIVSSKLSIVMFTRAKIIVFEFEKIQDFDEVCAFAQENGL